MFRISFFILLPPDVMCNRIQERDRLLINTSSLLTLLRFSIKWVKYPLRGLLQEHCTTAPTNRCLFEMQLGAWSDMQCNFRQFAARYVKQNFWQRPKQRLPSLLPKQYGNETKPFTATTACDTIRVVRSLFSDWNSKL